MNSIHSKSVRTPELVPFGNAYIFGRDNRYKYALSLVREQEDEREQNIDVSSCIFVLESLFITN